MSPSSKTTMPESANSNNPPMFTEEGLPLSPCFGASFATNDLGDGGAARRIDCLPSPQLISAPSLRTSETKTPLSHARGKVSLSPGLNNSSLIDDDEDELTGYFGMSSSGSAPLAHFALTSADNDTPHNILSQWDVQEHNVRTLPSFYPLEQSAVFVPQAAAPVLAARISGVLQDRSITASYDALNAKADCVSALQVGFCIRLYRGRGEFQHGIIVEVQRRAGFALTYAHDVSAILDAAEGESVKDTSSISSTPYETNGSKEVMAFPTLRNDILSPQSFSNC